MAQPDGRGWEAYRGNAGGIFCARYDADTAPFPPIYPCNACTGDCKEAWIAVLNSTNTLS